MTAHDEGQAQTEEAIFGHALGDRVEDIVDDDAPHRVRSIDRRVVTDDSLLEKRQEGELDGAERPLSRRLDEDREMSAPSGMG